MRDMTYDWCFEGGCTYMTEMDTDREDELHCEEFEALSNEPCIGMHD